MNDLVERRALQALIAIACAVPVLAGGAGLLSGPDFIRGGQDAAPDLDSHFRYLSGLLLGIGLGFVSCVPRIETKTQRIRLLGLVVVVGGIGRALGLVSHGAPGSAHQLALVMELGVVPLTVLWQARIARASRRHLDKLDASSA